MTSTFEAFLSPHVNRPSFISGWLTAHSVPNTQVLLSGRTHVVVRFANTAYDPRFRMKTLVAHHDRAPLTPGANDNSAACFQLMLFAWRLSRLTTIHNVRILFTDGEEAAGVSGIAAQGSYTVGSALRSRGEDIGDVYVLDATGRGDTLVVSTTALDSIKNRQLQRGMDILHQKTRQIARKTAQESWVSLPTPYSDNAGFLATGIPAQVLTILPATEATILLHAQSEYTTLDVLTKPALDDDSRLYYPETWKLMHTPNDGAHTLTPTAFSLMRIFLDNLARTMEGIE